MFSIFKNNILKLHNSDHRASTYLELFFDLEIVIALSKNTHLFHENIIHGHIYNGFVFMIFNFIGLWWAWMNWTWFSSSYDDYSRFYKIFSFIIILGSIIYASALDVFNLNKNNLYQILIAWSIMRVGMISLWVRLAFIIKEFRAKALMYVISLFFLQLSWCMLLIYSDIFSFNIFFLFTILIFCIEFFIPVLIEKYTENGLIHPKHISERYNLFFIILLGELLLSLSSGFNNIFNSHFDYNLLMIILTSFLIIIIIFWIYFSNVDHSPRNRNNIKHFFIWGYGHLFLYLGIAIIGGIIGVNIDFYIENKYTNQLYILIINYGILMFFMSLWITKDMKFDFYFIKTLIFCILILLSILFYLNLLISMTILFLFSLINKKKYILK